MKKHSLYHHWGKKSKQKMPNSNCSKPVYKPEKNIQIYFCDNTFKKQNPETVLNEYMFLLICLQQV